MGVAIPIPRSDAPADARRRLNRLRSLAWFLDRSIPIGSKWRIGVDPLLGLLPGIGDWIGAMLSVYVIYEGARLGMPTTVITRMAGNVLVETIIGAVPVVGDLFDFAWQANTRNLALIDKHYHPTREPRSLRRIWFALALVAVLVIALLAGLMFLVFKGIGAVLN